MTQQLKAIDATLMDCSDAFVEFNSQMGMLLNQDYLTEELLTDLVDASLMAPVVELEMTTYVSDVVELYAQKHAVDGEYQSAWKAITELARSVITAASLLPGYGSVERLPFRIDAIKAGIVFLKRTA